MKKLLILIALIIVVVGIVLGYKYFYKPAGDNSISMEVKTISEKTDFFDISAEYPFFKNIDENFNKKISDLVVNKISEFKKDSQDNWQARIDTLPPGQTLPESPEQTFDFIEKWNATQINNDYISFSMTIYFFSGGAHGITEVYAFNYDVKNKKEISIIDFLGGTGDALDKLSQLSESQITTQLESSGVTIDDILSQMVKDGTSPKTENYANFNFDQNSLIIYFQQYQVAPGYIGPVTIKLFKDALSQNSINSSYLK